jgi:plasmid maintenance system antidote protein VapI
LSFAKKSSIAYHRDKNKRKKMHLREYLWKKELTIQQFANIIKYDRTYVSLVMRGKKRIGKRMAEAIELATEGEVKAEELLKISDSEKKQKPIKEVPRLKEIILPKLSPKALKWNHRFSKIDFKLLFFCNTSDTLKV